MDEIPARGAGFGGNLSITIWNLSILYYENLKRRNRWSRRNDDLDLTRYLGGSFRFYQQEERSFILTYKLETPFKVEIMDHMRGHPQILLQKRHHILVPARKLRRLRRGYIDVKFHPPRLMRNQWYFQKHFCHVNLIMLTVSGIDTDRVWLRKGAESPVVQFCVLGADYTGKFESGNHTGPMSHTADDEVQRQTAWSEIWQFPKSMTTNFRDVLKDIGDASNTDVPAGIPLTNVPEKFKNHLTFHKTKQKFKERENKLKQLITHSPYSQSAGSRTYSQTLDRIFGIYSWIVLDPDKRWDQTHSKAYVTVRYNPLIDEGRGNRVYVESCSKESLIFDEKRASCLLEDEPLWLLLYGYTDWVRKEKRGGSPGTNVRVMINCPYTDPKLSKSRGQGFCIYSDDFAKGRLPYGQGSLTPFWENNWYPNLWNQEPALETIVDCGPWMPRDDESNSWMLNMGYRFRFLLGGNPLPGNPPQDPCKRPTFDLPETGMLDMAVQVRDPSRIDLPAHTWDLRRSLFTSRGLKRLLEDQTDDELTDSVTDDRKRFDPDVAPRSADPAASSSSLQALLLQPTPPGPSPIKRPRTSQPGTPEAQTPEEIHQCLKLELRKQQQQQRIIQRGIQEMLLNMHLKQLGYHVDPRLL